MKYLKPELEIVSFDEDKFVVLTLESITLGGGGGNPDGDLIEDGDEWENQSL